jgi:hypothetical protein
MSGGNLAAKTVDYGATRIRRSSLTVRGNQHPDRRVPQQLIYAGQLAV